MSSSPYHDGKESTEWAFWLLFPWAYEGKHLSIWSLHPHKQPNPMDQLEDFWGCNFQELIWMWIKLVSLNSLSHCFMVQQLHFVSVEPKLFSDGNVCEKWEFYMLQIKNQNEFCLWGNLAPMIHWEIALWMSSLWQEFSVWLSIKSLRIKGTSIRTILSFGDVARINV